jgi:glycerol kinase
MVVYGEVQRKYRWHEHDPDQIIQACEDCIDGAVKSIEAAGYPKSSIKVIGTTGI